MSGQWRSLEELAGTPGFQARFSAEFPSLTTAGEWNRRDILKVMGASAALAGLDGCERQADERALPYVVQPEGDVLGKPRFYATAIEFEGVAQPVIGTTRAGRPIKLEGNPDHPASGGKTDAFSQAALLGLYDPARSRTVVHDGRVSDWAAFDAMLDSLRRRFDTNGGAGFRLLTGHTRSPTALRLIGDMRRKWPQAQWHSWSAAPPPGPVRDLSQAAAIVSFDDDLLGAGPLQTWNARTWAARRIAYQQGQGEALLMVAEPTPTLTGVAANARLIAAEVRLAALMNALASRSFAGLDAKEAAWVQQAASALARNKGRALVTVGSHHAALQPLAMRLNAQFGGPQSLAVPAEQGQPIESLMADMAAGRVSVLAVLDCNPAYARAAFGPLMDRVPLRLHAGLHADETAARSQWHVPLAHDLESWGDARAADGSACLVQPLVRPWLAVRSLTALLAALTGEEGSDHDVVRQTWSGEWGDSGPAFENRWSATLVKGFIPATAPAAGQPQVNAGAEVASPPTSGLTVLIRPDPTVWDGSFSENAWLQELPKPLTKLVWGNAVHVSPALARRLDLAEGDEVELSAGGRTVTGPALVVPGQETNTVLVHLGYGRTHGGEVSRGLGFNAAVLGPAGTSIAGASLRKTGKRETVATTQEHFAIKANEFVRFVPVAGARLPAHASQPNMYPALPKTKPSWAMAIDLDLCIGCNACVTACVAENNIAMVGKEQVAKGRQMHWLRVDRYFEGPADDPKQMFQPVPCMHCEDAPCEMGCPVNATVHSPDGLNLQVYNRCIGTRTCSAYCPYKVRRFNWFDWTKDDPPELQAARNPEVTVRGRGVMEKCTYCIQRLQNARIDGEVEDEPNWASGVQTACQQACPTQAIVFGDISDPASPVSRRKSNGRDYALLEEANTRPRTTYSARIAGGEDEA